MRVEISVDPVDGAHRRGDRSRELADWLRREDPLRGHVRLSPGAIDAEQMGAVTDTIAIAVGTGGAGTALARTLVAWISHRTTDVKLTLTRPEGTKLSIDAQRVDDPQAFIASVTDFLAEPPVERSSDETA